MPQTLNIAVCEDEAAETLLLCDILNHSDIQNTYTVFTDADSFLASYEYGKYDLLLMVNNKQNRQDAKAVKANASFFALKMRRR